MNLDLNNKKTNDIEKNNFIKAFIEDLKKVIEKINNKEIEEEKMSEDIKLTNEEEIEYERKEFDFLQEYFSKELEDTSKGEVFIVTNKYENDDELHRYKVTQYKNNFECKYIAFEKDLPEDVKLRDVVRKIDGKYFYDEEATKYIKESLNSIKEDIINNRK